MVFALLVLGPGGLGAFGAGPLVDPLDGQPLGWRLAQADCPVEVRAHWLDATGGLQGKPCEAMTLAAGNGTQVLLEYRLDPSHVIDEVKASVHAQSLRGGVRIGLRIRYPRVIDPATRAPAEAVLWGDTHGGRNRWEMLAAQSIADRRAVLDMGMRGRYGATVDLDDAYIDAVVINAYTGTGTANLRLDNLRVDGLVPIKSTSTTGPFQPASTGRGTVSSVSPLESGTSLEHAPFSGVQFSAVQSAFPSGRVTRVIEYNGEQLEYLKLLGFDAVLLSRPPTAEFLSDAHQQSMLVYAPPPTAADPALEPFLSAVAGWYLGTSYDSSQLELASAEEARLAKLPSLWRRPCLIAPAEAWDRYAGIATSMVYDMPLPARGLLGDEETALVVDQMQRTGRPVVAAVGIATLPAQRLVTQLDAISQSLGAAPIEDYGWHSLWLQTVRALSVAPRAIVFRSTRSLESGREADGQRALVLSLVNRWLEIAAPLLANARHRGVMRPDNSAYQLTHLATPLGEVVLAHIQSLDMPSVGSLGGGASLRVPVPVGRNTYAWRITDMGVEQMLISGGPSERFVSVDSPDLVEWIVLSDHPDMGARLERSLRPHTLRVTQERWQLVADSLSRTREDWRAAVGGGLVPREALPTEMLSTAADSLARAQREIAANRTSSAMRLTRAADALALRCDAMLRGRLRPATVPPAGMPTLMAPGGTMLQLAWMPSLEDGDWTRNLLASGDLDDAGALVSSGWTHQRRLETVADAAVGIDPTAGEQGSGALRMETVARGTMALPGGYAGTVARVRSAPVKFAPGSWVRVDVRVKMMGYGGPHQGLLVYDSEAGSETGMLLKGDGRWRTVTMYRVITSDRPFRVTFESLGAGESLVDWVHVAMWRPPQAAPPVFRPIE